MKIVLNTRRRLKKKLKKKRNKKTERKSTSLLPITYVKLASEEKTPLKKDKPPLGVRYS